MRQLQWAYKNFYWKKSERLFLQEAVTKGEVVAAALRLVGAGVVPTY